MKVRTEVYELRREVIGSLGLILTLVGLVAEGPFRWAILFGATLVAYRAVAHRIANRKPNS